MVIFLDVRRYNEHTVDITAITPYNPASSLLYEFCPALIPGGKLVALQKGKKNVMVAFQPHGQEAPLLLDTNG
jgi:hypothetical protein